MNILVVEDHQELAVEVVDYLSKNGYICKWANNCAEALEEIDVNNYDVMLLDLG